MPSSEAIAALRRVKIEYTGRSKPLTAEMVRKADVVFCMTKAHLEAARALVSHDNNTDTIIELLDPAGDVEDPMGHGQKSYDALVTRFRKLIPLRIKETLPNENRARVGPSR